MTTDDDDRRRCCRSNNFSIGLCQQQITRSRLAVVQSYAFAHHTIASRVIIGTPCPPTGSAIGVGFALTHRSEDTGSFNEEKDTRCFSFCKSFPDLVLLWRCSNEFHVWLVNYTRCDASDDATQMPTLHNMIHTRGVLSCNFIGTGDATRDDDDAGTLQH